MMIAKPYYPLLFNPTTAVLSATGDGSGVATLSIQVSANTQVTISDNGNFYTDAAGTLGETKVWNVTSGAMRTIYLKVTSGTAKLTFAERRLVTHWGDTGSSGWVRSTNAPSITALEALRSAFPNLLQLRLDSEAGFVDELQDLPRELTYIHIYGSNTISGSLADAPADLTRIYIYGSNTISGSLADAPADLTYLRIYGSNTISGNLSDLPTGLTYLYIKGSNTISGSLADAPADLTYLRIYGSNTISDYTQGKVFANNFNRLQIDGVGGLSQSEMIDLIVDISAATWGGSSRTFSMSSPHADMSDTTQGGIWGDFSGTDDPSALATAYKTLIKTKSVSVTLNGITVPGTSGDGTGFPAGFGDWYRT